MNFDFLDRSIAGAMGELPTVTPRPVTDFEPLSNEGFEGEDLVEVHDEVVAARPEGRQQREIPGRKPPPKELSEVAGGSEPEPVSRQERSGLSEVSEDAPKPLGVEAREPQPSTGVHRDEPRVPEQPAEPTPKAAEPAREQTREKPAASLPVQPVIVREEIVTQPALKSELPGNVEREGEPSLVQIVKEEVTIETPAPDPEIRFRDRLREVSRTIREVHRQHVTQSKVLENETTEIRHEQQVLERRLFQDRQVAIPTVLDRMIQTEPSRESPPAVEVNIGRVEIHAAAPKQPAPARPAPPRPIRSSASLDDFLQKRGRDS